MKCVNDCEWDTETNAMAYSTEACFTDTDDDLCCGTVVVLTDPAGLECGDPENPQRTTFNLCNPIAHAPQYQRPTGIQNWYLNLAFPQIVHCEGGVHYYFGWARYRHACDVTGDPPEEWWYETASNEFTIRIERATECADGCDMQATGYYCGPISDFDCVTAPCST